MSKVIDTILAHEGGYQNDKADGANKNSNGQWVGTKFGITPAVYEEEFGEVPSASDMRSLSRVDAKRIYQDKYVDPVKINLKIDESDPRFTHVVDMVVNHGYSGAMAILQRASGAQVDGKVGPQTREAFVGVTNDQLADARVEEYGRIVKSQPEKSTFLKGWTNRANSFRDGKR
jgi:lysozyme family protein